MFYRRPSKKKQTLISSGKIIFDKKPLTLSNGQTNQRAKKKKYASQQIDRDKTRNIVGKNAFNLNF